MIICCYNSAARLPQTLLHISKQQLPAALPWEIVLVNNASTDETARVAEQVWAAYGNPAPLRLIDEPRPGTDHARRTGAYAARYKVFAFCDDDNWLAPDYLATGYRFLQDHPEVGLVGGQGEAVADIPLPGWFGEAASYYAAIAPAKASCDMTHWGLWGAGTMGRTHLLRKALTPDIPLLNAGRVGHLPSFGEDGEICMRVALMGFRIWYSDALKFWHWMPEARLSPIYRDMLLQELPKASEAIFTYIRALQFFRQKKWTRFYRFIWHYAAWLSGSKPRQKFARDYCYFFTGHEIFENQHNKTVINFKRFINS